MWCGAAMRLSSIILRVGDTERSLGFSRETGSTTNDAPVRAERQSSFESSRHVSAEPSFSGSSAPVAT